MLNAREIAGLAETGLGRPAAPTTFAPAEISETSAGRSDRWAVVLINDDHHSVDYVIWALLKTVPDLSDTEAALIMLEAHNTGKGIVTVCGREQAEGYRAVLLRLQLGCEIGERLVWHVGEGQGPDVLPTLNFSPVANCLENRWYNKPYRNPSLA